MNYLFELTHPKHYYQFKTLIRDLSNISSNKLIVIARDKDVLLAILKEDGVSFLIYGKHGKKILSKLYVLPKLFYNYWKIITKHKIDVVVSKASPYPAILSLFTRIKTVIEPDSEIVKLTQKLVAPRANIIITPYTYSIDYGKKHHRVKGFFEDTYLHPTVFKAQKSIVQNLGFDTEKPYFVLRFISWNANHDIYNYGFSDSEKIELVRLLKEKGQVFISSEGKLPSELEHFKIKIPASKIHQVLHFANMYIGDSQSMATESALLGTPAIRYNSFVGEKDMTNFIVLEKEYGLIRNYNNFLKVKMCVNEFLNNPDIKKNWLEKRKKYYEINEDINNHIFNIIKTIS